MSDKYTVVLRYRENESSSILTTSIHHVTTIDGPIQAVRHAFDECRKSDSSIEPTVIAVFAGHHDSIRWY